MFRTGAEPLLPKRHLLEATAYRGAEAELITEVVSQV